MNIPNYDDEHLCFGLLFMLSNRLQVLGDAFFEEITAKQWFFLAILGTFEDNHPTINELSNAIESSHQNVKQLALKLQQKELIELYPDEVDRRKCRIRMTSNCEQFNLKYQEKEIKFMSQLFNHIDPASLKTTVTTLIRLKENMEAL